MNIDPRKIGLAAAFKAPGMLEAYRKWALAPETARFLGLVADLVSPTPSDPVTRNTHSEAVAKLVRRETIDEFVTACQSLDEYANVVGETSLPPTTYGAEEPEGKKKKSDKTAKPAQA